jgi:diguanylate cyclase (GGDEF)-like protein
MLAALVGGLAAGLMGSAAGAQPLEIAGTLYHAEAGGWAFDGQPDLARAPGLHAAPRLARSGGRFWYQALVDIPQAGRWVIDFRHSGVIGRFEHHLFDLQGRRVAQAEGGLASAQRGPFPLRHGREFELPAGRYRLVTQLESTGFLGQPRPYLDTLAHYRQAIKWGNALALTGLGVLLGLALCYASMAMAQARLAYGMYALFIGGHLWFGAASLQALSDLAGPHPVWLVGLPVLLSSLAYVVFVMSLLSIGRAGHPSLWRLGLGTLAVLAALALPGLLRPAWMLDLGRAGTGLALIFGLVAGGVRTWQGNASARRYLAASLAFLVPALPALLMPDLAGVYTFHVEHISLAAAVLQVLLLALVLSYQLGQLQREHSAALVHADESLRIAHTDELTGAPNRFALNAALSALPAPGCLTFVDLDGLKHYNDAYGHDRGDELLQRFAQHWREMLGMRATVHRLGGDEFAVTCPDGDAAHVEATLQVVIDRLRDEGFELAGASHGTAWMHEHGDPSRLKQLADVRMYKHKRARREGGGVATAEVPAGEASAGA